MPKHWDNMTIYKGRHHILFDEWTSHKARYTKPLVEWSSYAKVLTIQNIMNECVDIHRRTSLQDAIEYFEHRIVNGSLELILLKYFVKQYKKPIDWHNVVHHYLTPTLFCAIIKKPEVYEIAYRNDLIRIFGLNDSIWNTEVVKKTMRYLKLSCPNSPLFLYKEYCSGETYLVFDKSLGSFDMKIENSSIDQLMVEINKL